MEGITINSLAEFVEQVCLLRQQLRDNYQKRINDGELIETERIEFLFRGHSNVDYDILPYLGRQRKINTGETYLGQERNMIEMARYKRPDVFKNDMSPLERLALMQHYEIPTRLLDVSENPLVALYFACFSKSETDGEVIVFRNISYNISNYSICEAIADTYRFEIFKQPIPLKRFYNFIAGQPYFSEIPKANDDEGANWVKDCCQDYFFVYAPIRTLRQEAQRGRYILFPNTIDDKNMCFVHGIEPIKKDNARYVVNRYIIPAGIKKELLYDLSTFGISKDILFCDSMDKICEEIVDRFS